MRNTEIVFTDKNKAVYRECAMPAVGDDQVLVRIEVSSISSGTERALLSGEINVSVFDFADKAVFPRYAGYSAAGVVTETGKNVKTLAAGDRVALSWSCHRRYIAVDEKNAYKIHDPSVGFGEAALVHIATFPLAAIRKCRPELGESAIVMGQGVLGLIAVELLALCGINPVIAADPVPDRRAKALERGADCAFDPFADDFAESVKKVTDGGACMAIEVTGNGGALNGVLDCMRRLGRVALLGCTRHSNFSVDYYHKVHGTGVSLIGAHTSARPALESSPGLWTQRDDANALLGLLAAKKLDLRSLIEETYPPAEAESVYKRLIGEKSFPVTQFDWSKEG